MSKWKSQAPTELAMPSSVDSNDHLKQGPRSQPVISPFPSGPIQQFPILTPERLLSPVDPGFLEGASLLARFGLDIGGTLCKVVYFEPAEDIAKDFLKLQSNAGSSPDESANRKMAKENCVHITKSSTEGGRDDIDGDCASGDNNTGDSLDKSIANVRNGCTSNGSEMKTSRSRAEDDNAVEHLPSGLDPLPQTNMSVMGGSSRSSEIEDGTSISVDSNRSVKNGESDGVRSTEVDSDSFPCSCGTPGVHISDHQREHTGKVREVAGGEDELNSRRQAKKMWVSSHEPIHLPGRGTLYFKCFETWRMEEFLDLTKEYHLVTGGRAIGATGGGARKFGDKFLEIAELQLQRADELKSLVRGIDFLARHAHQESFEYPTGSYQGGTIQRPWESPENSSDDGSDLSSEDYYSLMSCTEEPELVTTSPTMMSLAASSEVGLEKEKKRKKEKCPTLKGPVLARLGSGIWMGSNESLHPYLVVNIGSGVSILRVDSADQFERVGGTSLGGSTFLGLAAALTGCQSFEEAISLAMQGDSTHVDMLVGDIYGGDYTEMGLAATTVASSFGKLVQPRNNMEAQKPQHLAKAALLMVTNNIGSIAWLHARNAGVRSIMFTGSFLHNNKLAMRLLAVAMEFWSKGTTKAVFLRHEGHAGAMGALLSTLEPSNPLDALLLK